MVAVVDSTSRVPIVNLPSLTVIDLPTIGFPGGVRTARVLRVLLLVDGFTLRIIHLPSLVIISCTSRVSLIPSMLPPMMVDCTSRVPMVLPSMAVVGVPVVAAAVWWLVLARACVAHARSLVDHGELVAVGR